MLSSESKYTGAFLISEAIVCPNVPTPAAAGESYSWPSASARSAARGKPADQGGRLGAKPGVGDTDERRELAVAAPEAVGARPELVEVLLVGANPFN
ncbi:hypothetical protein GUJ93_ZPchr0003g18436 [Zizania palustris]|uniref:Uncharacterized protein n=1 Tax=Zizania palustris TaxID=103762 RepID=A0A8J5V6B2_ZIZPA|nr:hypothetical protein GUJ93_ZPchr0003g18436 [Zizania palustris]